MSRHADPLRARRAVYGVLAWLLLGLAWWGVLRRDPQTWLAQLVLPAVAVVVVTALTLGWVRHNQRIYARKGPRRGVPATDQPWTHDSLGRPLDFAPGVEAARVVRLQLDGHVKRYEVAS